jgi:hypothetical protein
MPDSIATADVPLWPALALHVNEVCQRFEAAWKAAAPAAPGPRVEDHLPGTPPAALACLRRHLVLLDIDYRRLRGEQPGAAEYQARFPDLSRRDLAAALAGPQHGGPAAPAPPAGEQPGEAVEEVTTVLPPPFAPQLRSDRYLLQRFHARGGIGEIWVAEDVEIGRQVALKRLRPQHEGQQDRFLMEAQITGQLEHPGIVPVHDLGIDEQGRPFYVMSFIHGRTLQDTLEDYHKGTPAPGEARAVQFARLLEVFIKVCQAVAYAHHRGVVHRDLKPNNVMLGPFGEALLLDWGLAKVSELPEASETSPVHLPPSSGSVQTQQGSILGTPAYMAPEMADGRGSDADERTDVYLLGATLYHLLTARRPRHGHSYSEGVELARTARRRRRARSRRTSRGPWRPSV